MLRPFNSNFGLDEIGDAALLVRRMMKLQLVRRRGQLLATVSDFRVERH
jgi:hypothetical protein